MKNYFNQLSKLTVTFSEDRMVVEAMEKYKNDPSSTAGDGYLSLYHNSFVKFINRFEIEDMLLADASTGCVVYTARKAGELGVCIKNLENGEGLKTAFNNSINVPGDSAVLTDFTFYKYDSGHPSAFISSPVVRDGLVTGVLFFRISAKVVNEIMTNDKNWKESGFGETGESYIVGSDYKMRNDSRFFIQDSLHYFEILKKTGAGSLIINKIKAQSSSIVVQEVKTEAVNEAFNGRSDTKITTDYRGVGVLSSYSRLAIPGLNWIIIAEIDTGEAFASVFSLREMLIMVGLFIVLFGGILSALVANNIAKPILKLISAAGSFGKGDLSYRVEVYAEDEIGILANTFNSMADKIMENTARLKTELEERKAIEEELTNSKEKLQNLSSYLQTARENERKLISREIHDELGQSLNALKLKLAVLKDNINKDDNDSHKRVTELFSMVDMTIKAVKRLITELRPQLLDDLGLSAAIEWYVLEFEKNSGIRCGISFYKEEFNLDPERNISVFRIIQEALTNVARHSGADNVEVSYSEVDDLIEVVIADNGRGIKPEEMENKHSFGILGIKERASYFKGEVFISGNNGTTVKVLFPKEIVK